MAQQPVPHLPALSEVQDNSPSDPLIARPSVELRVERSRFSRLLARFGLGELTDPILRPTKHPTEHDVG